MVQEGGACERRREQLAAPAREIARAITENEERLVEAVAGLEGDERTAEEGEARAVELRGRTLALGNEVDVAVGELTTLKMAATQAEERRQNARQTLERLRADRAEEEARAARIEATLAGDETRAATLRQDALAAARRGVALAGGGGGAGARPRRAPGRARGAAGARWPSARRSCGRRAPRSPG